ncbi:MAG: DNA helicase RecG [Candidatus Levybacteria bacterium CG10_big_fil_rev_8_21_14_0_10_36_7]|nr:MAG: DNA helicase RecG [Candidatus Levybacteria bacterium CG10_big_fil_rev_8_21_14_0_10_36_7]
MDLKTPIGQVGTTYKMNAKRLQKLGIETVEDLLFHIPFRYEDSSNISKIAQIQQGNNVSIKGQVINATTIRTKRGLAMQIISVEDETGRVDCIFFNQIYVLRTLKIGSYVSISGKSDKFGSKKSLLVKDYEILENIDSDTFHTGRLVPVYPETRGLGSKWIRNRIKDLLLKIEKIDEYLPQEILNEEKFIDLDMAMRSIHFPKTLEDEQKARLRLSFDELFLKHAQSKMRKKEWEEKKHTKAFEIKKYKKHLDKFIKSLPFTLTNSQTKAIDEILNDLSKTTPMNRLLEGDVGSGKTVVATAAIYIAYLNGFQATIMAPTEILAEQHFKSIKDMLEKFGMKVAIFTSSKKLNVDDFDVAVGTHALIHKKVKFKKLGLIVIDEQQRFGVTQRAILRDKGNNPHFLTMTATPIPRTVFLTIYSDLALSQLPEMPKGRKTIQTWLVPEKKRSAGYEWIKKTISDKGDQAFIVCPFIEESENATTVKAAKVEYERLKNEVFDQFNVGLLHGKMKSSEKNKILEEFKNGKIDILVTTPVVEVGIDIPNATIMLIEAAERFGLAQLHQLRGRVGRNDKESYCFLFTDSKSEDTNTRLKYLENVHFGAKLAEIDLELRGPGDMYGVAQHGANGLKIASFSDFTTLQKSKKAADKIFTNLDNYPKIKKKIKEVMDQKTTHD